MKTNESFSKQSNNSKNFPEGNWFRVPNRLIDGCGRVLGPSGIAVYCVLARYANNLTQEAFPSHKQIAQKVGISRRTVIRKIKKLQELGLIKDIKRMSKYCVYTLK